MDKQNEVSDESKILMMLVRIGDENVEKIDMHIDKLCTYLCKQIGRLKSYIIEVFLKCVFSIPNKQFIYAYILYSMANEKHEYVVDIINEVFDLFVQSVNKGEDVNIVMKFIAALADTGLLSISAFENLLEQLLGLHLAAIKENNDNDYFLNLVVVGYVFGRRLIRENVDPDSKPEIELTIERYLKQRPKTTDDYYVFKSRSFQSSIDQLWSAVAYSYVDGVPLEKKIYSLYLIPSDEFIIKLNCEQISTLPDISIESRFPYYKAPFCFELFADKCLEQSDKGLYAVSRDLCRNTLIAFQDNPYFACQRLSSFTCIPQLSYLLFDVIFDEIFRIPSSIKNTIFYTSICVTMVKEFTKEDEFEFGPVVGEALQIIFKIPENPSVEQIPKLEEMDIELIDRLVEFLAFFLSQQNFDWFWESWNFAIDLPDYSIHKVFIRNLLTKCCNITNIKSFVNTLPESFQVLINENKKGVFKYINESKDNYDAQIILDAMSSFEGSFSTSEFNVDTSGDQFIEIFMECLLYKSQKSLQHLKKLANRFLVMIKNTLSDENCQAKALEVVSNVWVNDEQKEISIYDQFINLEIVTPITMIKYLFERIRVNGFTKNMYAKEWKMLNKVINKQLIKFNSVMYSNGKDQSKLIQLPLSQLDDMEDVEHSNKEEIINETNQLISTILESFQICEQNIQESPSQGNTEDIELTQTLQIPTEKRLENILSRKKAITRSLFQDQLIKSLMA